MKLKLLQENLSSAVQIASRFASIKAQLPVLANIYLKTEKNKLYLIATNLENAICIALTSQIEDQGDITIPAKTLNDILVNLSQGTINLETEKENLKVSQEDFESVISGMNASDFPAVAKNLGVKTFSLDTIDFKHGLSKVVYAVSVDETRPTLTGVLMVYSQGSLSLVATDGFRLSKMILKTSAKISFDKIIIPKNTLNEVLRILSDKDKLVVEFQKDENQILFGLEDKILSSRIIEGEFPDFEKIIPKSSEITIGVEKDDLVRAVKLAAVFARDSANVVKINVFKEEIEVLSESSQGGSQKTKVDADVLTKQDLSKDKFTIAFNFRFLEDFLNSVDGDTVNMAFGDPNSPGVFTDPKDKDYLHLIMPVRLQS